MNLNTHTAEKPFTVIVKIGTNLLTKEDGSLNEKYIEDIIKQTIKIIRKKIKIVLVTSGAVAAGKNILKQRKERRIPSTMDCLEQKRQTIIEKFGLTPKYNPTDETISVKQAKAAVGQIDLMGVYRRLSKKFGSEAAQLLIDKNSIAKQKNRDTIRKTCDILYECGVIAVVNANDPVSSEELRHMANDTLAADVANIFDADMVINLTEHVNGIFTKDPRKYQNARHIPFLKKGKYERKVTCGNANTNGTGGVESKLKAASRLRKKCPMYVVDGNQKDILERIVLSGENPGTVIV